jgi:hypothetical protein
MKRKVEDVTSRLRSLIAGLCCAAGAGCGPAASDEYLGEPMLSVRGDVVLEALTGGAAVEPALCFGQFPAVAEAEPFTVTNAPSSVAQHFDGVSLSGLGVTHIVDVESRGEFPSEFNVEVYEPPPDSVLSRYFAGEPRMTRMAGTLCAVTEERSPVSRQVVSLGTNTCSEPGTPCSYSWLSISQDNERQYLETLDCAGSDSVLDDCSLSAEGDPALRYEYSDGIVGSAKGTAILYLADPAPAGSYSAWLLGRPDGMAAGYFLYDISDSGPSISPSAECAAQLGEQAVVQLNGELGSDYLFDGGALYAELDGNGAPKPPPQADQERWNEIHAGLVMASCPMPERTAVDADDDVSFRIEQNLQTVRDYAESTRVP